MAENSPSQGSGSIDWNTGDELEIDCISSSSVDLVIHGPAFNPGESSYSSKLFRHFMNMGFSETSVTRAIKEKGENNDSDVLDAILSYMELEKSSGEGHGYSTVSCPEPERSFAGDISDIDSYPVDNEKADELDEKDNKLSCLIDMGYNADEASAAIDTCGIDLDIVALVDFLDAAQIAKDPRDEMSPDEELGSGSYLKENTCEDVRNDNTFSQLIDMGYRAEDITKAIERCGLDAALPDLVEFISAAQIAMEADDQMDKLDHDKQVQKLKSRCIMGNYGLKTDKKRKFLRGETRKDKFQKIEDDGLLCLPNPMIGFGIPSETFRGVQRSLPEAARGLPYFYYENVALTPKGVWRKISNFLYEVVPEFVDSKYFCVAARKRGYIHNLPIDNRFPLRPLPPKTIFDSFPAFEKWWPLWDTREQFNCLLTCKGSAQLTDRIKAKLETSNGEPPLSVQQYVVQQCKKWNLVWVGKNKVAPLEPHEMETIMGFPKYHTRGLSITDRYKCLGNTFQVDTIAYHLSTLKKRFPNGINVLSLFSGIGGAELALHRLGIRLNNVVSVEKSEVCQGVLQSWWDQTQQQGRLLHVSDVREVTNEKLSRWMSSFGAFDLVIGGSPCNNLAGGNRHSRDGLEGEHSPFSMTMFASLTL